MYHCRYGHAGFLTVIPWARGMYVNCPLHLQYQLPFYCTFFKQSRRWSFLLNVPNTVIWEGEGEVSVSLLEQVPWGLVGREHVYIALHPRKKVKR